MCPQRRQYLRMPLIKKMQTSTARSAVFAEAANPAICEWQPIDVYHGTIGQTGAPLVKPAKPDSGDGSQSELNFAWSGISEISSESFYRSPQAHAQRFGGELNLPAMTDMDCRYGPD